MGPWYTAAAGGHLPLAALLAAEGAGILGFVAALLTGWRFLIALSLLPLLAPQAVVLLERGPLLLSPVLGATLLAASELAFWSIGARPPGPHSPRLLWRLGARVVGLAAGGVVLGWLVLAASGLRTAGTLDLTVIGSAALLVLLAAITWLVRAGLRELAQSAD